MNFRLSSTARGARCWLFPSRHAHSEDVITIAQERKASVLALSGDECIAIREWDALPFVRDPPLQLKASQEAVQLYEALAQANPAAAQPYLALSLSNLGEVLSGLGRREEALAVLGEAFNILWPFFKRIPAAFRRETSRLRQNLLQTHEALQRPLPRALEERLEEFTCLAELHQQPD